MNIKQIKENMSKCNNLSIYACKDSEAIRLHDEIDDDIRTPFFRDIDRIIYSLSYNRYIDKTQVFSNTDNDNISKRIIHVQLVSKIARTIGRALNLNEDLIEAASLAHDLGHVPFGHIGEKILNDISLKNNEGYFKHNVQSVRTLLKLEESGKGRNITIQVLDSILCHNGEELLQRYEPCNKTKEYFLEQYENCYKEKNNKLIPMTLEGCVVRISDVIGYIGRDLEDAILLGIISKDEIPASVKSILGNDNRTIINNIILDIVNNSYNKPYIKLSDNIFFALKELINFNYEKIYNKANSQEKIQEYNFKFNKLFDFYNKALENNELNNDIFIVFLNYMSDDYKKNTSKKRQVIDYIAGMTDDYFLSKYEDNCK